VENLPFAEKSDATTQFFDFIHVVGRKQNRRTLFTLKLFERSSSLFSNVRVESDGAFIQKEEFRVVDEPFTESDAGVLPGTQVLQLFIGQLGDLESFEEFVNPRAGIFHAVDVAIHPEILTNSENAVQAGEGGGNIHAPPNRE
jgi:hypothetical protein